MRGKISALYEVIEPWKVNGERVLESGTIQIGRAPSIGTEAWVHTLFSPLNTEDLSELEDQLECTLDQTLKDFYLCHNGLKLFGSYFSIYGVPSLITRQGEDSIQPYDFITHNLSRPDNYPVTAYVIGSVLTEEIVFNLLVDVSREDKHGTIYLYNKKDEMYICEWENIYIAIYEISQRLSGSMTADGEIPDFQSWNNFYEVFLSK